MTKTNLIKIGDLIINVAHIITARRVGTTVVLATAQPLPNPDSAGEFSRISHRSVPGSRGELVISGKEAEMLWNALAAASEDLGQLGTSGTGQE